MNHNALLCHFVYIEAETTFCLFSKSQYKCLKTLILKKTICQRCVNILFSCILISSTDRHTPTNTVVQYHTQKHTPTPPTHSGIKHLNTMKICMSFKSMEPPTSSYSIRFTTIYGFWLSQTGHSKLSYSVPVLSSFSNSSPSYHYTHHPATLFLVFPSGSHWFPI